MHQSVDLPQIWLSTTQLCKTMAATPGGVTNENDNIGRVHVVAYAILLHACLLNCHARMYIASLNAYILLSWL